MFALFDEICAVALAPLGIARRVVPSDDDLYVLSLSGFIASFYFSILVLALARALSIPLNSGLVGEIPSLAFVFPLFVLGVVLTKVYDPRPKARHFAASILVFVLAVSFL